MKSRDNGSSQRHTYGRGNNSHSDRGAIPGPVNALVLED